MQSQCYFMKQLWDQKLLSQTKTMKENYAPNPQNPTNQPNN
jgi:hypothetical protein